VNLWLPDQDGRHAVGELPAEVACSTYPRPGPAPEGILAAEFLVPSARVRWLRELIPQMGGLRVIQTVSAGVDWAIPLVQPGVRLCSARGTRDEAVAEWVTAAILASRKGLSEMRDHQLEHRWQWVQPGDLAGASVAILGYGSIGSAVEERLRPFGVGFIRIARRARPGVHAAGELRELLPQAGILIVLLPLTPGTRGMLEADLLGRLPAGALLVNAARGAIVDTAALTELVSAGRLRAALDVTDPEPLPPEHPLWDAPGVLITPHVAGDSPLADRRAFEFVGDQVRRYAAGERLANVVEGAY
jgi:phosphoglycerate dehydrogenase-like enzyme